MTVVGLEHQAPDKIAKAIEKLEAEANGTSTSTRRRRGSSLKQLTAKGMEAERNRDGQYNLNQSDPVPR